MTVGDHTYLGPAVRFMVGKKLSVGSYCLIASKIITDNPGHPIDNVLGRMSPGGGSPSPESIRPVTIGDFCFLPLDTVVYPGVTIGDGVVARVGTHLSQDVPPFCQVAGNPMRIVRKLPVPVELRDCVGAERYQGYLDAHKALCLERGRKL
jgi:acetyltransferase-like isoleucine patch superfamily enzyme